MSEGTALPRNDSGLTDAQREYVKREYFKKTATALASQLGVSRSTIAGIAHRAGLTKGRDPAPHVPGTGAEQRQRPRLPGSPLGRPEAERAEDAARAPKGPLRPPRRARRRLLSTRADDAWPTLLEALEAHARLAPGRVAIVDMPNLGLCRFPYGQGRSLLMCGEPTWRSYVYCRCHSRIAYSTTDGGARNKEVESKHGE